MFKNLFGKSDGGQTHPLTHDTAEEITLAGIRSVFAKDSDIVFREIYIGGNENMPVTLVCIDGLVNSKAIGDDVIMPLVKSERLSNLKTEKDAINLIEHGYVYFPSQRTRREMQEVLSDIVTGSCAVIFEKEKTALTFETKGFEQRAISEPTEENISKGPKDVFIENLRVNTATVRRKIKTPKLTVEQTIVGRQTRTPVAFVYIDGIVNEELVTEVKNRLDAIDIDGVIETCSIEEYISDNHLCTFPLVTATERPDTFAQNILDGRVGIIIDGIPIAFTAPAVIGQFLRTSDDYSQSFLTASLLRALRYFLMILSIFLPAFYISITTFHHEMIPSELAMSIIMAKEGVPYPSFFEVFLMLIAFETLIESGRRLPKSIGQAVSIVGALVVGEAAVNAKFISPSVVVIIAITAISGFAMPNQDFSNALRIWRFIMAVLASLLGLVGMSFGAILMLYALASIETFGVPYLSPYAATQGKDLKDSVFRFPLSMIKYRPSYLKTMNKRRQK